ncbi:MAG: hypothetical protein HXY43_12340 [Fischerella sp.]|nr:hypothetical protein [Fischerella sp.]
MTLDLLGSSTTTLEEFSTHHSLLGISEKARKYTVLQTNARLVLVLQ